MAVIINFIILFLIMVLNSGVEIRTTLSNISEQHISESSTLEPNDTTYICIGYKNTLDFIAKYSEGKYDYIEASLPWSVHDYPSEWTEKQLKSETEKYIFYSYVKAITRNTIFSAYSNGRWVGDYKVKKLIPSGVGMVDNIAAELQPLSENTDVMEKNPSLVAVNKKSNETSSKLFSTTKKILDENEFQHVKKHLKKILKKDKYLKKIDREKIICHVGVLTPDDGLTYIVTCNTDTDDFGLSLLLVFSLKNGVFNDKCLIDKFFPHEGGNASLLEEGGSYYDFYDVFDVDNDGSAELFFYIEEWESVSFAILSKIGQRYKTVFKNGLGGV